MKTIPTPHPEPETGRNYWRSLDQLAETPAFREWVEREFPNGASECKDPITRRHFVKIMSASFLLAGVGLTGCRRPEETIYPFAHMPENYTHGMPQYFATSMPIRDSAIPLVVKSNEGRPTKIEGNAQHPDGNGATDAFAQASILQLYDPDRAQRFTREGNDVTWAATFDFLAKLSKQLAASEGRGLCILMERSSSPSRARLQAALSQKLPQAQWFVYEPVDFHQARSVMSLAQGEPVAPVYRFDQAGVIVSLDCDFLGVEEEAHRHIRGFAARRRITKPTDPLNRLYVIEGLMSLTGVNADHRLRIPTSMVSQLAARLAAEVLRQAGTPESANFANATSRLVDEQGLRSLGEQLKKEDPAWITKWITECARDLLANRGNSLVVAGHRQPPSVHLLAHALNSVLGNVGKTILLRSAPETEGRSLAELSQKLASDQVETLVVLGGNPVYNAPADLDWAKTQRRAKTVIRLGYYEDETYTVSDWHLPAAHYLESWGDARTSDGTLVPVQPLIEPLFGGLTELEVLARLGGMEKTNPYEIVRETFKGIADANEFEARWKKCLHDGYAANSAAKVLDSKWDWEKATQMLNGAKPGLPPSKEQLEVVFQRDHSVDDGRYNNNGWLQEMPDPVTKLTWDNAILISRRTAEELGVKNYDLVEIKLGDRLVTGPIWVQPGMADYSLGIALGYGRQRAGRVGQKTGFNAYAIRASNAMYAAVGGTIRKTGQEYLLSCTQHHWSMEGRAIVREANLKQFTEHQDFATAMNAEAAPSEKPMYPNPLDKIKLTATHQWGMVIDLNACVGCSACIMACQSENNVPIVGKEQVSKGREMHWIRIDRYYASEPSKKEGTSKTAPDESQQFQKWIDDPQVINQPMLCQHCEAAPCENVCPVNATVHDEEGLNVMAYNRCVGTRYCSNNCPYKVRRFNFFDYNKRPFQNHQLYLGPLARKPADEMELAKLFKNPDVTVRMRGVMEKCSYCLQRIEQAKIAQKIKAGASGDVEVPDGTIKTACQQACPAEAIVFGNVADPKSQVSKLKATPRNYSVLELLATKPRTTYLARVRNPNPLMPDYHELPLSTMEFEAGGGEKENPAHATAGGIPASEKGAR